MSESLIGLGFNLICCYRNSTIVSMYNNPPGGTKSFILLRFRLNLSDCDGCSSAICSVSINTDCPAGTFSACFHILSIHNSSSAKVYTHINTFCSP